MSQAVLSAANFAVGLILIRGASDAQYGYYVLAASAILLLVSLQNSFFSPPLAMRVHRLDRSARSKLVGGLYREQQRFVWIGAGAVMLLALCLWALGVLDAHTGPLLLIVAVAAIAISHREYFRMVLLAHRRPLDVLRTDFLYVALIVLGVIVATFTTAPAIVAVLALAIGAFVSGGLLSRGFGRDEPWDKQGVPNILRDIAPLATWSTAGAAVHWTFSQGYVYLVVSALDVTAVAAIAATRLLLMPVNLLSTGIGSLMLPLASGWLHRFGAPLVLRRLCAFAAVLAIVTLCYFGIIWALRDWIFTALLKKQFPQRDDLLLLWGALFLVMVIRDQLVYLLAAQGRFRVLTSLTTVCAIVSLIASVWCMQHFGVVGALMGMLLGEMLNVAGIAILAFQKTVRPSVAAAQ